MGYTLDKDGIKDIKYCDYVEITDVNDDEYIYNVFYSDEYGLCLYTEDEPLIKFLHIRNSRLESYYVTGEDRKSTRLNSSHTRPSRMPSSA